MVEINLMEEINVETIPGIDLLMNDKKPGDKNSSEKKEEKNNTLDELELEFPVNFIILE